jgi:hypothetical protein
VNTWYSLLPTNTHLVSFDKRNAADVDSVVFVGLLETSSDDNTAFAELYNVNDRLRIVGSIIKSQGVIQTWVTSPNLYEQLPDHETTLGVRIHSGQQGSRIGIASAHLFLYRK